MSSLSQSFPFNGHFSGEPGLPGSPVGPLFFGTETSGVFLQARCPSFHLINSVKAPKETRNNMHWPWPGKISPVLASPYLCLDSWRRGVDLFYAGSKEGKVAQPFTSSKPTVSRVSPQQRRHQLIVFLHARCPSFHRCKKPSYNNKKNVTNRDNWQ